MDKIKGIVTALVTPFNQDGTIDEISIKELIKFQKNKVDGLFALGSSGEGILMDLDQRKKALELIVEENNNQVDVIAHVGSINTKDTIDLVKHAVANKVDYISAISPFFFKVSDKAIINHYLKIAEAANGTPFFLYNNPALAVNHISENVVKFFYENVPNFVGIKDSSKSLDNLSSYRKLAKEKYVFVGGDRIVNKALNLKVNGAVSTLSNVYPELFTNLYKANLNNNQEEAEYYQDIINRVLDILFEFSYFSTIKKLLNYRIPTIKSSYCINPIIDLSDEEEAIMKRKLETIKELGALK